MEDKEALDDLYGILKEGSSAFWVLFDGLSCGKTRGGRIHVI